MVRVQAGRVVLSVLRLLRGDLIYFKAPGILSSALHMVAGYPLLCTRGFMLCLILLEYSFHGSGIVQLLYRSTCDALRSCMYHAAESSIHMAQSRPMQHVRVLCSSRDLRFVTRARHFNAQV